MCCDLAVLQPVKEIRRKQIGTCLPVEIPQPIPKPKPQPKPKRKPVELKVVLPDNTQVVIPKKVCGISSRYSLLPEQRLEPGLRPSCLSTSLSEPPSSPCHVSGVTVSALKDALMIRHHLSLTSTGWRMKGKWGTRQDLQSQGVRGAVILAFRVLQGEPQTGANQCQWKLPESGQFHLLGLVIPGNVSWPWTV